MDIKKVQVYCLEASKGGNHGATKSLSDQLKKSSGELDALKTAQPPETFNLRFLEGLGFPSSNDRLIWGFSRASGS